MSRILVFISFIMFSFRLFSVDVEYIKSSDQYIWGLGEANSMRSADKMALSQLISGISVQVESKFTSVMTESEGEVHETVESCVNTYSSTTLQNTERKVWEEGDRQYVLRYILKTDLQLVFASREAKIKDYIKTGVEAEKDARIGDAINNYYWALLLLRSHPDNQTMIYVNEQNESRRLITAIPAHLETLLSDLDFKLESQEYNQERDSRIATMYVTYNQKPVENIEFRYHMGDSWSPIQSGRDGIVAMKFFGEASHSLSSVRVRVEYIYEYKAQIDKEVFAIIDNDAMDLPVVDNREFRINLKTINHDTDHAEVLVGIDDSDDNESAKSMGSENNEIFKVIPIILGGIKGKNHNAVKSYFTDEGWDVYSKLIMYGNAETLGHNVELKTVKVNDEIFVRSIPMLFTFPNNRGSFVEKLVFTFNEEGKISDLNFALSDKAVNDLVKKDERFGSEEDKFYLIHFMEIYKTSYCLKRIDYIENLFADDALIIVGRKVKKDLSIATENLPKFKQVDDYEFVQKTKGEYINGLRNVFRSSEFINLHFEDNTVKKFRKDEKVYGIQIAQHYTSSSYADKGYLFLMVDLKDKAEPKIYVRSWQPEKKADGSVIGLEDFIMN